jgi:signal transduction histidine kinase
MKVKDIRILFIQSGFQEEQADDELKIVLYRIIQEQITNILKHAKASEVVITLKKAVRKLSLTVSDNGIGFKLSDARKGIGLNNIKNRTEIYNGQVSITSSPGSGCSLKIIFEI